MEQTWIDTFELIMKGWLVNILGFLGIVANILIIIVLRHCKIKSNIRLIMKGNFFSINLIPGGHSILRRPSLHNFEHLSPPLVDNYEHFT
jgi:hypothetical protein